MVAISVRIINQYKFKYQTVFSAKFDREDRYGEMLDETDFFNKIIFQSKFNRV